jgi:hypothetical protein
MNEFSNNQEFEQFVIEYGYRFHNCQQFTVNDLLQFMPSANKTRVQYALDDLAIKGSIKKLNSNFYQVQDKRTLKQKVEDCFGNKYVFFSVEQISNLLKQRSDYVKDVITELVSEGKLCRCPFIGGAFWLTAEDN